MLNTIREYLEHGAYAWPGGYPVYAWMADGEPLCFDCVKNESEVHEDPSECNEQWRFVGADVYWEGPAMSCAHCNRELESAYGDPDAETEVQS